MNGTLLLHRNFPSRYVRPRNVNVWLPPGYADDADARYPVIYMHDGQNLFDPATANIGVDWGMDAALTGLIRGAEISGVIVVGIWCTAERAREYMPARAFETPQGRSARAGFIHRQGGGPLSEEYLQFVTGELKPEIDRLYRTAPDCKDTYMIGSSRGGLISLYALCEHPETFSGAGCLSTHWPAADGVVLPYLSAALPHAGSHKFYFDHGTETLDALYEAYQLQVDRMMRQAGYVEGQDWVTHRYLGEEHSERAWRKRVQIPLNFLLS